MNLVSASLKDVGRMSAKRYGERGWGVEGEGRGVKILPAGERRGEEVL